MRIATAAALAVLLAATPVPKRSLPEGDWGGPHVALKVSSTGARLELDCAHGRIDGPIALDGDGRFEIRGTYDKESAGPARSSDSKSGRPALYSGRIEGDAMRLEIVQSDTGAAVGSFTLERGRFARIVKCR